MELTKIVKRINDLLAGETLSYQELLPFLDAAIDDINNDLSAAYPVFSELEEGATVYDFFPAMYIRSVVCYGAVVHFYQTDEEGGQPPMGYMQTYQTNKYMMLRDWAQYVPPEYCKPEFTAALNTAIVVAPEDFYA